MSLKKLVLTIALITPFLSKAQTPIKDTNCGISQETADLIKQRLMSNREMIERLGIKEISNGRSITYIPLTINNVASDASGLGKTSEPTIYSFLCGLNTLYADQDIQFFIQGQIRDRISPAIYTNASSTTSSAHMLGYKVANTLNITIGASINNPRASWYNGAGDYCFFLQQMISPQAITEGHEIGHFFGIPHTFYGWENRDVEALYGGGNVPATIGFGAKTENAPRTGTQANCATAADGFCDTPADYYSDRKNCPYSPTVNDFHGNAINPDETNIMSYANDNCITGFSLEQKAAIRSDIIVRNWTNFMPASTLDVTGIPTVVSPLHNEDLGDVNNSTVLLDWTDVPGATAYYLEVYGTKLPGVWLLDQTKPIYRATIYSTTSSFNLPTTNLVAGARYVWKVKALNSLRTCAGFSQNATFLAVTNTTTDIKDLPIEKQMTLTVNSNPISGADIPLSIYSAQELIGSIRVYAIDGREVLAMNKQVISEGESLVQLPAGHLTNGIYLAVLTTERGLLQQKLIIQR